MKTLWADRGEKPGGDKGWGRDNELRGDNPKRSSEMANWVIEGEMEKGWKHWALTGYSWKGLWRKGPLHRGQEEFHWAELHMTEFSSKQSMCHPVTPNTLLQ